MLCLLWSDINFAHNLELAASGQDSWKILKLAATLGKLLWIVSIFTLTFDNGLEIEPTLCREKSALTEGHRSFWQFLWMLLWTLLWMLEWVGEYLRVIVAICG